MNSAIWLVLYTARIFLSLPRGTITVTQVFVLLLVVFQSEFPFFEFLSKKPLKCTSFFQNSQVSLLHLQSTMCLLVWLEVKELKKMIWESEEKQVICQLRVSPYGFGQHFQDLGHCAFILNGHPNHWITYLFKTLIQLQEAQSRCCFRSKYSSQNKHQNFFLITKSSLCLKWSNHEKKRFCCHFFVSD